ncbi:MAG: O-antigen polymerase [Bacteriovorax sp.]
MNIQKRIFIWLILYLYLPVLDLGGHRIVLAEFYTYCIFFLNVKKIRTNDLVTPYLFYFVSFFITVIFTAFLAKASINNHDIYTLRNIFQFYMAMLLFDTSFCAFEVEYSRAEFELFLFRCLIILSIPALIVYFQRLNFFGFRGIITSLYRPKFFFLDAASFSEFRYTSVFQDFFTEALYFITVMGLMFYFFLVNNLKTVWKIFTLILLIFVYGAQFFVSRTSLMVTFILMGGILFFSSGLKPLQSLRKAIMFFVLSLPIAAIGVHFLLSSNLVNAEWALEGFSFLSSEPTSSAHNFSSFTAMNSLVENFYNYIKENPNILFIPNHEYNLTVRDNPYVYTDSFYGQEIYRYGIYGIFSYLIFVVLLFRALWRKNMTILLLVVFYIFLNYKGGNVFFMEKNIYIYAFVFAALSAYQKYILKEKR